LHNLKFSSDYAFDAILACLLMFSSLNVTMIHLAKIFGKLAKEMTLLISLQALFNKLPICAIHLD